MNLTEKTYTFKELIYLYYLFCFATVLGVCVILSPKNYIAYNLLLISGCLIILIFLVQRGKI